MRESLKAGTPSFWHTRRLASAALSGEVVLQAGGRSRVDHKAKMRQSTVNSQFDCLSSRSSGWRACMLLISVSSRSCWRTLKDKNASAIFA
jgi:hypothetical protein